MNGLDYVIIAVIGLSALIGFMRGFTKEALSLITWSGAGMITYIFFPVAKGFTLHYISNPMVADGLTMFTLFVVFLIILSLVANSVAGFVRNSALSGVDRGLGLGFGSVRGLILVCAAEIIFTTFTPRDKQSPTILKAKFIHSVRSGSDQLMAILPTHVRSYINAQSHGLTKPMSDHLKDQMKNSLPNGVPGQTPAPNEDPSDTGVLVALPGMGGMSMPQSTPSQANTASSVSEDPNKMMESLAQLKIRNDGVADEKTAADTKYNGHELDRLVTVANDEDKVKTMPNKASKPSGGGGSDHDEDHEDHDED